MTNLRNQNVLIIGGATGTGFATAKLAEQLQARVIIAGHSKEKNEKALLRLSDRAESIYVDVLSADSISNLFTLVEKFDHVFITASPGGTGDFSSATMNIKETYMYGKFWSVFMVTKKAVEKISKNGSITFVTGGFSAKFTKGTTLVTAAYNAVEGFAKALTVEMAPIRFNVIRPGFIDSGFWDHLDKPARNQLFQESKKKTAVGRIGKPDDIAHMATSIMMNSFVNGQVVEVNGGQIPE